MREFMLRSLLWLLLQTAMDPVTFMDQSDFGYFSTLVRHKRGVFFFRLEYFLVWAVKLYHL